MVKFNPPNANTGKVEIIFPVRWSYRAVVDATNPNALENLNSILEKHHYSERFAAGSVSSGQRYRSFHVEVEVPSREAMNQLAKELGSVEGVKFLL